MNSKLAEVEAGRAAEYLEPLAVLLENMQVRTKVAGNWNRQWAACHRTHWPFQLYFCLYQVSTESCVWSRSSTSTTVRPRQLVNTGRSGTRTLLSSSLRLQGLRERSSRILWFRVFVQSEKLLLFDTVQNELEEKIRRLEEDRHSIDITSGNRGHYAIFVTSAQHVVVTNQVPELNDPARASVRAVDRRGVGEEEEERCFKSR